MVQSAYGAIPTEARELERMTPDKKDTMLCFPRPIWTVTFTDYEGVNSALRREMGRLDWNALEEETRLRYAADHSFSEDRFVTLEQVPTYQTILELFLRQCVEIIEGLQWDVAGHELGISEFWVHLTEPGELTQAHRHAPSLLSGVYYVDVPPGCGNIVFIDDYPHGFYEPKVKAGKQNYLGWRDLEFEAKEGGMIIFPGWMNHKVKRNRSDRRRLSLSFNASLARSP